MSQLILNVGCGTNPLKSSDDVIYINMDALEAPKVDCTYVQQDITKLPYQFPNNHFDRVYMFHCIEHIPEEYHVRLLEEFWRILKPGAILALSYPEFIKCALNYINNHQGMRDFWKATIYGRGRDDWDRHKALMDSPIFANVVRNCGFEGILHSPEFNEPFNTILTARKGNKMFTYEELLGESLARS